MTNKNNSGMTIVEVLVSVVIISLVMSLLFTLLIQVQKANTAVTEKSSLLISQAVVTKAIEADMIEIGVHGVSLCEPEDFNINGSLIDKTAGYVCVKLEFNLTYDVSDLGYIMVYKQSADKYEQPSWVIKYERGYYEDCIAGQAPDENNHWKGTYSVVQKLDSDISLSSDNKAILRYSASYVPDTKYSEQRTNNASLNIPITDSNEYHYDIDLSFSFKLYYPDGVNARYQDRVDFYCDNTNISSLGDSDKQLSCECSGSSCNSTLASVASNNKKKPDGSYLYVCSETKTSTIEAAGLNKSFMTLETVQSAGLTPSNIRSVHFSGNVANPYKKNGKPANQGIDVSYSKNNTVVLYFDQVTEGADKGLYDITITQSGYVGLYGTSMAKMFSGFTSLQEIDFQFLDTAGITNMSSLFKNCAKLTDNNKETGLMHFEALNFDSVENMSNMFYGCKKITRTHFKNGSNPIQLNKLSNAINMYYGSGITSFIYGTDFYAPNIETMQSMFAYCASLSTFKMQGTSESWLTFEKLNDLSSLCKEVDKISNAAFTYLNLPSLRSLDSSFYNATSYSTNYDFSYLKMPQLKSASHMFYQGYFNDGLKMVKWETPVLEDVSYMFYNCYIYTLDLTTFDFDNVTNCTSIAESGYNIKAVIIKDNWQNVKSMNSLFNSCWAMKSFKLISEDGVWHLPNVTSARSTFVGASEDVGLTGFGEIKGFYMPQCSDFYNMFYRSAFDVIHFDGINSEVPAGTTIDCSSLFAASSGLSNEKYYITRNITMRNANFKGKVNVSSMFSYRTGLVFSDYEGDIDIAKYYNDEYELVDNPLDNFTVDTGRITSMSYMFRGCVALKGLPDNFFEDFNTSECSYYDYAFENFGRDNPGSHIGNKYGLVIPFTITKTTGTRMFAGIKSVPFIKFTGTVNVSYSSYSFFADIEPYSYMDEFRLEFENLNSSSQSSMKSLFDTFNKDINVPVVIKLSSNSTLGKTQYCGIISSSLYTLAKNLTFENQVSSWTC